jgi:hypothetical protein
VGSEQVLFFPLLIVSAAHYVCHHKNRLPPARRAGIGVLDNVKYRQSLSACSVIKPTAFCVLAAHVELPAKNIKPGICQQLCPSFLKVNSTSISALIAMFCRLTINPQNCGFNFSYLPGHFGHSAGLYSADFPRFRFPLPLNCRVTSPKLNPQNCGFNFLPSNRRKIRHSAGKVTQSARRIYKRILYRR